VPVPKLLKSFVRLGIYAAAILVVLTAQISNPASPATALRAVADTSRNPWPSIIRMALLVILALGLAIELAGTGRRPQWR
jgi:protein-S-isoprenylcysteine O-methyltransferase Ste14